MSSIGARINVYGNSFDETYSTIIGNEIDNDDENKNDILKICHEL